MGNPLSTSQVVDQLSLYTEYQLVVTASLASGVSLSSSKMVFSTSSKWRLEVRDTKWRNVSVTSYYSHQVIIGNN